jgi:hypothetical protein
VKLRWLKYGLLSAGNASTHGMFLMEQEDLRNAPPAKAAICRVPANSAEEKKRAEDAGGFHGQGIL